MPKNKLSGTPSHPALRPPIVAVLGHVDHGKTSLLDYIRHASVAQKEHGGITQHIGAYQVEVKNEKSHRDESLEMRGEGNKTKQSSQLSTLSPQLITFIDTPGHEAFAKMRSRGANAADIAILVVAADDSVKPQTKESIDQIHAANIPMIVAINKIDLESANVNKVKQDLAKVGVQLEGFGGEVPWVGVSAKTGAGIPTLLDTIILVWEVSGGKPYSEGAFSGVVIETQIDKGKGLVASVVVKEGSLKYATKLYEEDRLVGKVRALSDEWGKNVPEAPPGKPVQVMGFDVLPDIGTVLFDRPISPIVVPKPEEPYVAPGLPDFLKPMSEIEQKLNVLLKTDTAGSLEAIIGSLPDKITLVSTGVGEINEADVLQARSTGAFIVGFNVGVKREAEKLAETEKVVCRTYFIIYELLDELREVVSGLKEVVTGEREMGQGLIQAQFPFDKQIIAGTKVTSGRIAKGDNVKILRGEQEVGRARVRSIRQGKLEVTKVEEGGECGVLFDKTVAFSLNDVIIAIIK